MRGTSQASRDAVLREFEPVVTASGADGLVIADQLFTAVDALDASGSLRRALTDPARPAGDKAALVARLFSSFDARVRDVLVAFVQARWSDEADLAEAIDDAGERAIFAYSLEQGTLDQVEEELFRVQRELVANRELLTALGNRSATKETRLALLSGVLGGKLLPTTEALLRRVVGTPRGNRLLVAIDGLLESAATHRERLVAKVDAAVELSAKQRARLASILSEAYGREVTINVAVDPEVLGGIRVQVGSEVVDGTVLARLDEARRRLVG
ncbi:F0F1 ATP synthase subunit delta [Demequina lignilytica]|uniref:ATP synthase subunit delta n=1 Tax=Demequina lignilytica TaxID=3051663 RepID=A0AAW7M9C0_9MICO|nr:MULTISPECIES: F0F1 ATP synthase subunit delta [unclassified Demequina]MDN4479119.1 F0F1 ATP synthase subunit delta [Demequina sp. SYSU T00039-1]MDN4482557.1 F0F1 ATP synthase subunit delta [Demequina sp. SYSU T0a273]MDN4489168.1 F0F1 ATP synthase subunit delta [Demequina sp. SYSU T00039]MDN4490271.1 F0F1 ATP synthase subunit delta [Demequina sp. SYSU T00068]